jgi:hypothetical protein
LLLIFRAIHALANGVRNKMNIRHRNIKVIKKMRLSYQYLSLNCF